MRLVVFILTGLFGQKVGKDEFGNKYYCSRFRLFNRERRWVVYRGSAESSKVPVNFEVWLRHVTVHPLLFNNYDWQEVTHKPNLTGTRHAFNPMDVNKKTDSYNHYKSWLNNK